ncbi:MAG: hypothetical protein PHE33_02340 [Bacteroidales bacterium]|nr:hypothetical protein [Bacteroidales bacterium]
MKKIIAHIVFLTLATSVFSQNIPVRDPYFIRDIEKSSLSIDKKEHSAIKPYYFTDHKEVCVDSTQYEKSFLYYGWKGKLDKSPASFYALPVYEVFNLFEFDDKNDFYYRYNIHFGGLFDYSFGEKFGVSYQLSAWILELPDYQINKRYSFPVYNNLGRPVPNRSDLLIENDVRITYAPYDFLTLELANSRLFYGDGYRSFLLSDFASNYPYFKLETSFLSIKYSCVWAVHKSFTKSTSVIDELSYFSQNKFDVVHYLDWKIGKRFNLGLFEAIITVKDDFFDFEYLNPIIFFRPVEFSLGSEDNAVFGTNMKFIINDRNALYGQFVLDDVIVGQLINDIRHNTNPDYTGEYGWFANKWAAQFGFKSYDIFKIKNLDVFTEFNIARPYIYSHSISKQNYSHSAQALAHPLGANFVESVSGISYLGKRFIIDAKLMYAIVGADSTNTHFGQDIYKPTMDGNQGYPYIVNSYGNTVLQGIRTEMITAKLDVGFILKENKNLSINLGLLMRYSNPEIGEGTFQNIVCFGVKSNFVKREVLY